MSEVADLELCRELWELSGWGYNQLDKNWCHGRLVNRGSIDTREVHEHIPAYTLGYLLRKLQDAGEWLTMTNSEGDWFIKDVLIDRSYHATETIPEDAACRLAIELIKQNIITPEQAGEER